MFKYKINCVYDFETKTHWALKDGQTLDDIRPLINEYTKDNINIESTPNPTLNYIPSANTINELFQK